MEISTEHYELVKDVLQLVGNIPLTSHWCRIKRMRLPLTARLTGTFRKKPTVPLVTSTSAAASKYTPSNITASPLPSLPAGSQHSAVLSNPSWQQTTPLTNSQAHAATQGASSQIQGYILFGVQAGRRTLVPAQVPVYDRSTDCSVFKEIRQCYQAQRGQLRLRFSIWRLEYCAVAKVSIIFKTFDQLLIPPINFNRLSVKHMVPEYQDLPKHQDYQYNPRAGDPDARNPPLSPHLFEALYYTCPMPCTRWYPHNCFPLPNSTTIVARFPKRVKSFQKDKTSPIWGLEAVFAISAAHVITYHLILVAGPFAFFGCWAWAHPGDLQNASVPATIAIGAVSLLWMISGILTGRKID